tara:strand:- start:492 stop:659 length:168 start_codon:yes stop_codon:yes gene_type:complete
MFKKIFNLFIGGENQNEKLIKNIENYEQKERQKQSQSSNLKRDKLHRQKNEKIQK